MIYDFRVLSLRDDLIIYRRVVHIDALGCCSAYAKNHCRTEKRDSRLGRDIHMFHSLLQFLPCGIITIIIHVNDQLSVL